ncbi:hypothetical protein DFH09DRAFT_1148772 [Mycena vulgaris]|nr:hypothetical protein DFH09DRAFT_1148772 [Mycena vulgaris]
MGASHESGGPHRHWRAPAKDSHTGIRHRESWHERRPVMQPFLCALPLSRTRGLEGAAVFAHIAAQVTVAQGHAFDSKFGNSDLPSSTQMNDTGVHAKPQREGRGCWQYVVAVKRKSGVAKRPMWRHSKFHKIMPRSIKAPERASGCSKSEAGPRQTSV